MKKLYFTVYFEQSDNDTLSGIKNIYVYEIVDNTPKEFTYIECSNEDNSEEEIGKWLNDNGYGDDEYHLTEL